MQHMSRVADQDISTAERAHVCAIKIEQHSSHAALLTKLLYPGLMLRMSSCKLAMCSCVICL